MKFIRKQGSLKLSGKMILLFIVLVLFQSFVSLTTLTMIISKTNLGALNAQMTHTLSGVEGYLKETFKDLRVKGELIAGQKKTIDYTDFGLENLLTRELILFKKSLGIDTIAIYIHPDFSFASSSQFDVTPTSYRDQLVQSFQGSNRLFISNLNSNTSLIILSPIRRGEKIIGVISLSKIIDHAFIERIEKIISSNIAFRFENIFIHGDVLSQEGIEQIVNTYTERSVTETSIVKVEDFIVGSVDLENLGLLGGEIYCLLDTAESTRQIRRYNLISLLSTCLILSLALVIGIVFYQLTFSRRFQTILQGIEKIAGGNFDPPFRLDWQDEFGQLAAAFDNMCHKLLIREKELSQLSRYNTLVLENVRSGIISINLSKEITAINPAAERILSLGLKKPLGRSADSNLIAPTLLAVFLEGLEKDSYRIGREISISQQNSRKILTVSSSPLLSPDGERIGIIVIFEDITKEKSLEEKLTLSSKLAALGEMAAGVSHQFRNPLVVMKVSAEMLRDKFSVREGQEKYQKLTHLMIDEIDTLNLVIANFLDFARPRKISRSYHSVRSVIDFSLDSLPLERFHDIEIHRVIEEGLPDYSLDKNLITQALSNLILNSLQASKRGDSIEVRAHMPDGMLCIEVQDWGVGMNEETKRNIFNPFFTTKDSGTGLGLSIAHRIIESHGGTIDVHSSPMKGSTFSICL